MDIFLMIQPLFFFLAAGLLRADCDTIVVAHVIYDISGIGPLRLKLYACVGSELILIHHSCVYQYEERGGENVARMYGLCIG